MNCFKKRQCRIKRYNNSTTPILKKSKNNTEEEKGKDDIENKWENNKPLSFIQSTDSLKKNIVVLYFFIIFIRKNLIMISQKLTIMKILKNQ